MKSQIPKMICSLCGQSCCIHGPEFQTPDENWKLNPKTGRGENIKTKRRKK